MKKRFVLYFVTVFIVGIILGFSFSRLHSKEKFEVARALIQFQDAIRDKNYSAAYDMLSDEGKKKLLFDGFVINAEHGLYDDGKWDWGYTCYYYGDEARLELSTSKTFGITYGFIKEGGKWKFTGDTTAFEYLLLW